jgi:hypothetical protein
LILAGLVPASFIFGSPDVVVSVVYVPAKYRNSWVAGSSPIGAKIRLACGAAETVAAAK